MLFTASTVKDSAANLRRFVTGNLAGGIDHLVVFVDAPEATDPAALEVLESHPSVTCVRTGEEWWQGDRPGQLNTRQRINANLTKAVLSRVPGAEWVFHIDADEIAQVDRAALASAPADARVVRLAPLEAVSQRAWAADPTRVQAAARQGRPDPAAHARRDRPRAQRRLLPRPRRREGGRAARPSTCG